MNTTPRSLLLAAACAAFALSGNSEAAVRTKAATGTDLTAGASWDTLPGSGDVATWTSTSLGASLTIGSSIEWQGINVSGALTDIAITAADTTTRLTIGSSGITLTGTRNLTLGANLGIGANQTWSIDGGRSLVLLAASRNANGTGNIDIVQTGSGVANVRMSQNGNNASWANFSGNITVNSNVTVQSEGNAAAAFGTGTITLNGGQITQANGNWTWSNNIDVTAASVIGNNSSNGLGRTLKLTGNLTSSNSSGLTFTNNITGGTRTDNLGFLLAGAGPSTYTTTTISANSRVRVGGTADNTVASPGLNAGNRGSLGTGDVTLSATTSELAFTRTDAHTVGNKITGSGTVVIGGNTTELAGTSTQVVTLSGASDYTGATRVSRSRLNLTGSLTSAITVDNSGSISGTGSTNQLLTLASTGRIALVGGATTTSITANGATFSGSNVVTFLSAPVNTTVYDVFTYGAGAVTTPGNLTADARGTLSNDVGNQKYIFTATGPATRTWNTTTGTWDLNTTTSFLEDDQKFVSWDNVVFGNVASDSVVTLSGTIVPGSVTVNNAANKYTFAGAAITGTTSLTKSGAGTLELTVANTYTGGTTLNAGTLQVGNASALGTGTLTVTGGTLTSGSTELSIANNITLNGSVILTGTAGTQGMRLNGVIGGAGGITKEGTGRFTIVNDSLATPNTFAGSTTVNAGILAVSINALASSSSVHVAGTTDGGLAIGGNGTTSIKNLTGTVDGRIRSDFNLSGNGARTLKITQTTNGTFAGAFIEGGSRQISLVKEGSATLTLSGSGGYTGSTSVNEGTLLVNGSGSTGSGAVTVASGATLGGTGTISGAVTVTGKIAPGDGGIGTLNTGAVTWKGATSAGTDTNWNFALGSANSADKLNITGNFTKDTALGSVFNFDFLGSAFTGIFTLAQWTGSTTFAASDFSYSNLGGGHTGTFTINGATKELQFTAVPEPTSAVAGLLLGAGLLRRRREKNVEC